ncbi:DUF1428 domain-containing protein [Colwellia sp. E2M01]|uniref:DUF1428 domain-containing protein n=1 Tax=Colwellia sp. E2M01 TaxID=2841561 RepID=UPI001C096182|nr:DUF1428 domain-containing protein [Colwellia sp. E2M01]MBU2870899.1 DUF1428 domain-containing protein [Colwellia sp. E2M01]
MSYIDGFVAAVPTDNKAKYLEHAKISAQIFKEYGAINIVETWEDDVPEGEITSFPLAVKKQVGESIVFSWVTWPSKEVRDLGWQKMMDDPKMAPENNPMPFDGKRLIYGGFNTILNE